MLRQYGSRKSQPDKRWHPLAITAGAVIILFTTSLTATPWKLLFLLSVIAIGIEWSGGSLRRSLSRVKFLFWMLPLTFLIHIGLSPEGWSFFRQLFGGQVEWTLLTNAVRFTLQILGFLLLMGGVIQLIRAQALIDSLLRLLAPLRSLGVPVDPLFQMLNLGIRFIPVLSDETQRIREVRRGLGITESRGMKQRIESYVSAMTSLFIGALYRAEVIGRMMHLRGYRTDVLRTNYSQHSWEVGDTTLVGLSLGIMLVVWWV